MFWTGYELRCMITFIRSMNTRKISHAKEYNILWWYKLISGNPLTTGMYSIESAC
jgi:hypothetical protein